MEITVCEMMAAREKRAFTQSELVEKYSCPLVCLTMNIAGGEKAYPLARHGFFVGADRIERKIDKYTLLYKEVRTLITGDEAYFAVDCDAQILKSLMVEIEEEDSLGRLFDIDVIGVDKLKLSRELARKCIVCSQPAVSCARSRNHGLPAIQAATKKILRTHFAKELAALCKRALITEVNVTPKPGLVDRNSNGAHTDMDIALFTKSAQTLEAYFSQMALCAMESCEKPIHTLMDELRKIGISAEAAMLNATAGVNTHKGAIYTLGLITAAASVILETGSESNDVLDIAYAIGANDARVSLESISVPVSNGEKVYSAYGFGGARGEVAGGFATVKLALLAQKKYQAACENDRLALTLANIMTNAQDTNVLHRAGKPGIEYMHSAMRELSALDNGERLKKLAELDETFTRLNISAGGCADILACVVFISDFELQSYRRA